MGKVEEDVRQDDLLSGEELADVDKEGSGVGILFEEGKTARHFSRLSQIPNKTIAHQSIVNIYYKPEHSVGYYLCKSS